MFASFLTTIFFALSVIFASRSVRILGGQAANLSRMCVAFVLLGVALSSSSREQSPGQASRRRWSFARVALLSFGAAILLAQVDLYAANARLVASEDAAARGDLSAARAAARQAHALEPWAASPALQVALVDEARGQLPEAERWVRRALRLDDSDWRTWLVAARIETKNGDLGNARFSIVRAWSINPNSPVMAALRPHTP